MSYEVTLTPEAKRDLREIYRYIAVELQSEQNANGQLDRLEETILKLDEMPERFRVYDREPWRSRNLRVMPVDNYLVFYIPDHQVKPSRCSASCTVGGILTPSSVIFRGEFVAVSFIPIPSGTSGVWWFGFH